MNDSTAADQFCGANVIATVPHVALLIETSRTYTREILSGVKRFVCENGPWSVFLELHALESNLPAWIRDWRGDGILCRSWGQRMQDTIANTGIPTVELRGYKLKQSLPFVGVDNHALGRMIAQHFVDRSFRNFGCYEIHSEAFFDERRDSFVERLAEMGFSCDCYQQRNRSERPLRWEDQQRQLVKWVEHLTKPVAVMACSDQLGFWLLDACHRAAIAVPEEVAVVGVEDDDALCEMANPPMSSVRYSGRKIGYEAAALLGRMMEGAPAPTEPLLLPPSGITTRQSSDVVSTNDIQVARSLRFIRDHAARGISVADVCVAANCSRSTLERRMQRILGRTPAEEILRVRLERVRLLLTETELSISEVAMRTGFAHPQYLGTVFRDRFGQTPGQYRKLHAVPKW
jgi:LacI family transcriptional regulator, galactose operon repressor